MKNQRHSVLISITCVFAAFILGFLVGRNYNHTDVQVSNLNVRAAAISETTQPVPSVSETIAPTEATTVPQTEVPSTTQAAATEPTIQPTEIQAGALININTASLSELITLPGIGEVIGQRIIDYREANGPFTNIAQLTNVSGIGSKRFAAIVDMITVE